MPVPVLTSKIEVYAGDSWSQSFVAKVPVVPITDPIVYEPEDLTGWADWKCQWRAAETSTDSVELVVNVDATEGTITVSATPAQTRAMGKDGVADVQAVKDSDVRTFIRFRTDWKRDITRD